MNGLLSFEAHPEIVAAFRFMFWSMFFGLSAIALSYTRNSKRMDWAPAIIPFGVFLTFMGFSLHQFYYWLTHRARAHADVDLISVLGEIRHVTSILLIVMCVGGVLYASEYMGSLFGKYWMPVTVLVMTGLWMIGYSDARWF